VRACAHRSVQAMTAVGAYYEDENLDFLEPSSEKAYEYFDKVQLHSTRPPARPPARLHARPHTHTHTHTHRLSVYRGLAHALL
jgi:hypothetical protein